MNENGASDTIEEGEGDFSSYVCAFVAWFWILLLDVLPSLPWSI